MVPTWYVWETSSLGKTIWWRRNSPHAPIKSSQNPGRIGLRATTIDVVKVWELCGQHDQVDEVAQMQWWRIAHGMRVIKLYREQQSRYLREAHMLLLFSRGLYHAMCSLETSWIIYPLENIWGFRDSGRGLLYNVLSRWQSVWPRCIHKRVGRHAKLLLVARLQIL